MKQKNNAGQTIGGSADVLATMSEFELIALMCDTHDELNRLHPFNDKERFDECMILFDRIVKTYYDRFPNHYKTTK